MITGFNTDIKHGERVFHVQTEDRGMGNPVVESLVYVGGEILLSKKSSYKEQVKESRVDEKIVKDMMDLQHRRIIEAIRRGRFDGVKPGDTAPVDEPIVPAPAISPAAAAAAAAMLSTKSGPFAAVRPPASAAPTPRPAAPAPAPAPTPAPKSAAELPRNESGSRPPLSMPRPAGMDGPSSGVLPRPGSGSFPRVGPPPMPKPVSVSAPPAAAAAPAPRATAGDRSLDQVIIEYLASEAASEHLELSLMSGGELIAGDSVPLTIRACTSLTEKPVAGAHVSVRVVSTSGPPQILFRGVTGSDGLVKATCTIPEIGGASAALIIAASSSLGNNEIKQLIRKRK